MPPHKSNEKKRKAENHCRYLMGGIIVTYFPDCYHYDKDELNRILSVTLLPENAPKEFADHATLWNSVELA